jgi:hypothetical protein
MRPCQGGPDSGQEGKDPRKIDLFGPPYALSLRFFRTVNGLISRSGLPYAIRRL